MTPTRYRGHAARRACASATGRRSTRRTWSRRFAAWSTPRWPARYARTYERIARIEVVDARTLVFHLDGAARDVPDRPRAADPARRGRASRTWARSARQPPVGAGPYVLTHREAGRIELRRESALARRPSAPSARAHAGRPRRQHARAAAARGRRRSRAERGAAAAAAAVRGATRASACRARPASARPTSA